SSWLCGASVSKGYLVAGKLTSRWSASSSQMRRPSTQHRSARGGDDSLLSMDPNIGVNQGLAMLLNQPLNIAKFRLAEAVVGPERNWSQPELGFAILAFNV